MRIFSGRKDERKQQKIQKIITALLPVKLLLVKIRNPPSPFKMAPPCANKFNTVCLHDKRKKQEKSKSMRPTEGNEENGEKERESKQRA